jgi:NADPH-dependent curcumin reductase CurA
MSKDKNKSNDRNKVLIIKIVKGMKKMFFALVAMVMMTMSANAQSNDNNGKLTFDRLASYLELRINQVEPVKTAMAQFESSMEAYYQVKDVSKAIETWEKIQTRHKQTMKKILSEKQYDKYVKTLDMTVSNASDRMTDGQLASK